MKKLFLILTLSVLWLHAGAVLNEKNLESTLKVLRVELEATSKGLEKLTEMIKLSSAKQHQQMIESMQKSNQTALMLYSQKQTYTFNLAYACHEASTQYHEFTNNMMPYDKIMKYMDTEITRYSYLIEVLETLPPSLSEDKHNHELDGEHHEDHGDIHNHEEEEHHHEEDLNHEEDEEKHMIDSLEQANIIDSLRKVIHNTQKKQVQPFVLTKQGLIDRLACLQSARSILKKYKEMHAEFNLDSEHYEHIKLHLEEVYHYAQQRYRDIQKSIFINGDESYFTNLGHIKRSWQQVKRDLTDKYGNKNYEHNHVKSEWRGGIVFGLILFVLFYITLSFLFSNFIVRILMKKVNKLKENKDLQLKTDCIVFASSFFLFAIAIMIIKIFMRHNFIIMASELLISFSWLLTIILTSLLIRLSGEQIKNALKLFMPIIVLGFLVIVFRIIFIPNTLVNLIFPPILLLFTLWQYLALKKSRKNVPFSDKIYTIISLILMCIATILAWSGYVLMSVQIFIWWLIQLMIILTITCIYDIMIEQEKRFLMKKLNLKKLNSRGWLKREGKDIEHSWFFDFLLMAVLPIGIILSFIISLYMAAQVFDLTEICARVFFLTFVNIPDFCQISIAKIVLLSSLYFIFNYACYIIKAFYRSIRMKHLKKKNGGISVATNQANFTLFYNITSIVIWGSYFIIILIVLQVPKSGISIVTAGLATGIGFAMKDLLENFFYGISLMTGRLRVGDWIECDGIRGKVDSITYQSTSIITDDGSIIAFLNSALFTKNFMNLTRNHSYVKSKVPVGVAYGTNIEQVRKVLIENISKMAYKNSGGRDVMDTKKGVTVSLTNFGDSSVDLVVSYWTLVSEKIAFDCKVKETIYNTLNKNKIEIPFPQCDLHIISQPEKV